MERPVGFIVTFLKQLGNFLAKLILSYGDVFSLLVNEKCLRSINQKSITTSYYLMSRNIQ